MASCSGARALGRAQHGHAAAGLVKHSRMTARKPAVHHPLRCAQARRAFHTKALKTPQEPGKKEAVSSSMPVWLSSLYSRWKDATPSQQAYIAVAALAALFLLPRALILAFVGVERLFVGLLLEIEELMVALTLKTIAAVSAAARSGAGRCVQRARGSSPAACALGCRGAAARP